MVVFGDYVQPKKSLVFTLSIIRIKLCQPNNWPGLSFEYKSRLGLSEQLSLLIRPNKRTRKMRLFVPIILIICCFLGTIQAGSEPLQCHQGNFHIKQTGTEVTPCSSSKAKSCQIVYTRSTMRVVQSCITTLCSVSSFIRNS